MPMLRTRLRSILVPAGLAIGVSSAGAVNPSPEAVLRQEVADRAGPRMDVAERPRSEVQGPPEERPGEVPVAPVEGRLAELVEELHLLVDHPHGEGVGGPD